MTEYTAYYFGCRERAGHYFQDVTGKTDLNATRIVPHSLQFPAAWNKLMDTGLLKNGKVLDQYTGKVHWTCASTKWFAFVWWDNSVDTRGGSNSGFYVHGFELGQAQEAFAFACASFRRVVERQKFPLVIVSTWHNHDHCPEGCEHPQPFVRDNKQYCGRCWFVHHKLTEMLPCTDDIC